MSRFVVHGIVVEEPKSVTTSNGLDCVTIVVEEKFRTPYNKEIINFYSIDFVGRAVNCVPMDMRMVGCPVVITGSIRGREFKEKYYNDLNGDALTIIDTNAFVSHKQSAPTQAQVKSEPENEELKSRNLETIEIDDDDLPF